MKVNVIDKENKPVYLLSYIQHIIDKVGELEKDSQELCLEMDNFPDIEQITEFRIKASTIYRNLSDLKKIL